MSVYTMQPIVQPRLSNRPPVEQQTNKQQTNKNLYSAKFVDKTRQRRWVVYTNTQPVVEPVWQSVVSCKRGFRQPGLMSHSTH